MEEAKVEMQDSPSDPNETLTLTATPTIISAKDVWSALECVQKKHRRFLVPALRKLQRMPTEVFEAIERGEEVNLSDYNLTDADRTFVLAVITYAS